MYQIEAMEHHFRVKNAKKCHSDRVEEMKSGKVWEPMSKGPFVVVHWKPLTKKGLFVSHEFSNVDFSKFIHRTIRPSSNNGKYSKDGIRFRNKDKDISRVHPDNGFVQREFWHAKIFRNGVLEMALALSYQPCSDTNAKWIREVYFVQRVWTAMEGFCNGLSSLGYVGPMLVGVCILHSKHCGLLGMEDGKPITEPYTDDDIDMVDEFDYNLGAQECTVLYQQNIECPTLNFLYQCFGIRKCNIYDGNGQRGPF